MNEFKLFNRSSNLLKYYENNILNNIPKVHSMYKTNIRENLVSLCENIIRANVNTGSIRGKYQKEILVNISMLDMYLSILLELDIINKKKFMIVIQRLNEIKKMNIGWMYEKVK